MPSNVQFDFKSNWSLECFVGQNTQKHTTNSLLQFLPQMKASTIISLAFFAIDSAIPAPSSDLLLSSPANLIAALPQLVRRGHKKSKSGKSGKKSSKSGKEEEDNHVDEIVPIIPTLSSCHHGVYGFNCRQMVTLHILLNGNANGHHDEEEEHVHEDHDYNGGLNVENCHPGEYGFNCVMMIQMHYLIHNAEDHHDE
jgi:hypothetical protein